MRVCWNRQTGTFEGRVSRDVWVQVPLLAPEKSCEMHDFFVYVKYLRHTSGAIPLWAAVLYHLAGYSGPAFSFL